MILETLRSKKIVIYGTGHVARIFCKTLYHHGMQKHILCFTRTFGVNSSEVFEGIPVIRFSDLSLDQDTIICLAVHESIRNEIEKTVVEKTAQYIWIYPYLYELMFGVPEQTEIEADVKILLKDFHEDLRLGVRLAAIEQQNEKNYYGFDYYVRAQMMHCSRNTAVYRLKQFQRLIKEWQQYGYRKEYLLTFNRNLGVIDGNHRLAMAVYTGQQTIYGNIYPTDLTIPEIHGYESMLSAKFLRQHGFSLNDTQKIEEIQKRYLQRYECRNTEIQT